MVKLKPNQNVFLTALLIVLIITIFLFFGIVSFDNYRRSNLEEDIKILNQQLLLDELYKNYLDHQGNNDYNDKCVILEKQLDSQYLLNRKLLDRLRTINKDAIVSTDNYVKFMYVLTNIKLWMHYNNYNSECDGDSKIMLYFYTEEKVSGSERIKINAKNDLFENRLTSFHKRCDNAVIFALPYLPEILVLDQILKDYNVTHSPAIVVEDKAIYNINDLADVSCN